MLLFVSTLFILLLALGPGSACLAPSTPHRARSNGMAGGTATGRTGAPPTTAEMIRIQRDCRNAARRRQPAGVRAFPLPSGAGPAGQAPPEAGPRARRWACRAERDGGVDRPVAMGGADVFDSKELTD